MNAPAGAGRSPSGTDRRAAPAGRPVQVERAALRGAGDRQRDQLADRRFDERLAVAGGEEAGRGLVAEQDRATVVGEHDPLGDDIERADELLLGGARSRGRILAGRASIAARSAATDGRLVDVGRRSVGAPVPAAAPAMRAVSASSRFRQLRSLRTRSAGLAEVRARLRSMWSATGAQSADVMPLMIVTAA